jgi:hypothetical protein
MVDPLKYNADLVESLGGALRSGQAGLHSIPGLLDQILTDQLWREFTTRLGAHVTYDRFEDFVTTPMVRGLGTDVDTVRRIVRDNARLLDLLDQALQRPSSIHPASNNITPNRALGTSREQALRKLRKDRPDLHARVIDGELSPHAAAVEAGFRKRTITMPREPDAAARALRRHFDATELAAIAKALQPQHQHREAS